MKARSPAVPLLLAALAISLLGAGLLACAPQGTSGDASPAPATTAGKAEAASRGTVIGTRPLLVRGEGLGMGPASAPRIARSSFTEIEITVRSDSGQDLQFVQANPEALRAGDRVTIAPPGRSPALTRLAGSGPVLAIASGTEGENVVAERAAD
ncbi:hypothetical protein SAMN02745194_00582 [Roseomonas rosea]|uniref:DUF5666 domain-containing protein n=1 Tax=Muricoccus roseus TaxID=198092 RepID=A0A1M6C4I0_9PROT|nr:hypothetical protein [Roseomonas rosea]SHI55930.1 hypothetical protein SAMN02745194_00582 [Roseomonas rosea]